MSGWRERLTTPREQFIPPVVWVDDPATGGFAAVSKSSDETRWRALVDADEPIITQVDDGRTPPGGIGLQPSSSCSQPSLVAAMLDALGAGAGHKVLEIGTGTGWCAAELRSRVGEHGEVVSVEVDPRIAERARGALRRAGCSVTVITADGMDGYLPAAPYDRVIATASVRAVPRAWLEQTRVGGVLVVPWGTDYCNGTLLRLEVGEDGSASGRCGMNLAFMRVREQRRNYLEPSPAELRSAQRSTTTRSIAELYEMIAYSRAAFAIGLRVPRCYRTAEELTPDHRRIELHDTTSNSWARVDLTRGAEKSDVLQFGPRRLWNEADAAYDWWLTAGRPGPQRFGLTISPEGDHTTWIDTPTSATSWLVAGPQS
ncbi:methyltransferase domain-containing protein [Saccharopolyspora indica]|uniref:methyltransferase domain-containing protein n=1 Tax=Saccharopolyspora indica TaxID=1229659 RepID=UPI0022EAD514|nr:methyltransferase domain-containing protein [Saccharopolyspora indica]MDA3648364.1 methyltransferase domain-containing protein [Saccharopolyspora indica]